MILTVLVNDDNDIISSCKSYETFVLVINSEPGDHNLPNLLFCSSNFTDEQYLSLLECGSYHLIVSMLLVLPMNDPYFLR